MYQKYAELRDSRELTDYAVSKRSGVARSVLSDWRNGKHSPNVENLTKIAEFFNVSIEYLTSGREPEQKSHTILTFEEESIITAYRALEESQKALVCQMLGIKRDFVSLKEA